MRSRSAAGNPLHSSDLILLSPKDLKSGSLKRRKPPILNQSACVLAASSFCFPFFCFSTLFGHSVPFESDRKRVTPRGRKNGKNIQRTNSKNNMQYMQRAIVLLQITQQTLHVLSLRKRNIYGFNQTVSEKQTR